MCQCCSSRHPSWWPAESQQAVWCSEHSHGSAFIPNSNDELIRRPPKPTVLGKNKCKFPVLKQYGSQLRTLSPLTAGIHCIDLLQKPYHNKGSETFIKQQAWLGKGDTLLSMKTQPGWACACRRTHWSLRTLNLPLSPRKHTEPCPGSHK